MILFRKEVTNRAIKILKIFLLTFSGSIIITELSLRYILGLGDPALSISDPQIEYMFKPNQNVKRFGNQIIVNQYGMRTNPISPLKKSDEQLRVMVFGDSVVNGGNLTDHQRLATTIVQDRLEQAEYGSVVVGNISAGSWGPGNWLAYAREYGFFDADKIILVISSHDYADNPNFTPLNPNTHPQTKPTFALQEFFNRYLNRYLPKFPFQTNLPLAETSKITPVTHTKDRGLNDLKKFLLMAKSSNADVYLIQYWDRQEIQSERTNKGHQEIKQLAQKLDIPVWQTKSLFVDADRQNQEPFRDSIHPSDRGQKLLAQLMLNILTNQSR